MAAVVGSLLVEVQADNSSLAKALTASGVDLSQLESKTTRSLSAMDRQYSSKFSAMARSTKTFSSSTSSAFSRMDRSFAGFGKSLLPPLGAISAALSAQEVRKYADAWTSAKNSLAVAGVTGARQADILNQLYESAQKNATPINALTSLYGKAAQASDNLGASQSDLLKFSDGVATALRVAGTSSEEASGALTQLGQLLGQARVQAEEFNSVNEGARPILMAVANGLDAAGGSVSKLKQLVNDGKVTGQQFFQAFLKGLPSIQAMAANSTETIGQGFVKIDNAMTKYIGSTDSSLGASQRLVKGLDTLADNFDTIADTTVKVASVIAAALVGRAIGGMILKLAEAGVSIGKFVAALRAARAAAAVSSLGAAAGPIGAALGLAAGAALYFATSSDKAADSTETAAEKADRYAEALKRVDEAAKGAGGAVKQASQDFDKIETARLEKRLSGDQAEYQKQADDIAAAVDKVLASLKEVEGEFGNDAGYKAEVAALQSVRGNLDGTVEGTQKAIAALVEFGKQDPAIQKIVDQFDLLKRKIVGVAAAVKDSKQSIGSMQSALSSQDGDKAGYVAWANDRDKTNTALGKRLTDAQRTELQVQIDKRTQDILKEFGDKITAAAARIQATNEIMAERATSSRESAIKGFSDRVISSESGGNANATNPNSSAAGLGQFITSTWLKLFKENFPDRAKSMSDSAILALRSDSETSRVLIEAYARGNADILQKAGVSVDEAALQLAHFLGPQGAISVLTAKSGTLASSVLSPAAVKANPTILDHGATVDDVIAYGQKRAGMSTAGTQRLDDRADFDKSLASEKKYLQQMQEESALRASLVGGINDHGRALSTLQKAQELLNAAQEHGIAAGKELSSAQQLLHGDLSMLSPAAREQAEAMRALAMQYGQVDASAAQAAESQQKLSREVSDWRDFSKDATKGFIDDLRAGKSAGEALSGVLDKLISKLEDMALDSIFGTGKSGGLLGSLFGGLFGGGGGGQFAAARSGSLLPGLFADGGYTGDGGKHEPAGIVHRGEFVMSKEATRRIGTGNLTAMHDAALRGYADGGLVGSSTPSLALPSPAVPSTVKSDAYHPASSTAVTSQGTKMAGDVRHSQSKQVDGLHISFETKVAEDGTLQTYVTGVAQKESSKSVKSGISQYDSALPDRMNQIKRNPNKR